MASNDFMVAAQLLAAAKNADIQQVQALVNNGANVNFVEPVGEGTIKVRTYEKGVEDETFACGTGIVASCIASFVNGLKPSEICQDGRVRYDVKAKRDVLSVDFIPSENLVAEDVWLTGPATFVAEIIVEL